MLSRTTSQVYGTAWDLLLSSGTAYRIETDGVLPALRYVWVGNTLVLKECKYPRTAAYYADLEFFDLT